MMATSRKQAAARLLGAAGALAVTQSLPEDQLKAAVADFS